jgi:hypothetical protein
MSYSVGNRGPEEFYYQESDLAGNLQSKSKGGKQNPRQRENGYCQKLGRR